MKGRGARRKSGEELGAFLERRAKESQEVFSIQDEGHDFLVIGSVNPCGGRFGLRRMAHGVEDEISSRERSEGATSEKNLAFDTRRSQFGLRIALAELDLAAKRVAGPYSRRVRQHGDQ